MGKLYVVKDGIYKSGYVSKDGKQLKDGRFYLLTYSFKDNTGYIRKREDGTWRLYTSIGNPPDFKKRYHRFASFEECVEKLQELSGENKVEVIDNFEKKEE